MSSEKIAGPTFHNILLVEDDDSFRKTIRGVCEDLGFEVREAENGLVAKTIFDLNTDKFHLIISDVRMPESDGIAFLKHVRTVNRKVKVIMMTGFSELLEARQAFELGANEFIAKPFRRELLAKVIEHCQRSKQAREKAELEETDAYCRIPVEEFISTSKLIADLFIQVSDRRYIMIGRAGEIVDVNRLRSYKEKQVDFFYVKAEDLRKLVGFSLELSKLSNDQRSLSKDKRLKLLQNTAQLITQSWFYTEVDKNSLKDAAQILENTLSIVSESQDIMSLIDFLRSSGDREYTHSVAVAVYSCMVAKKLGMASQLTQTRLSLGGLLHDIGKKELPNSILQKTRFEMTAAEIETYESHCARGKEILALVAGIPEDVITIAAHHHENNVSTGFPYHLSSRQIHPLAKIVAPVDGFCSALKRSELSGNVDIRSIFVKFANLHKDEFDAPVMRALGSLIGSDLPKEK